MTKTREQKENLVTGLNKKLDQAKSAVLIDYKGLKVKETEELRNILRGKNVDFHITKNSLVKIALKKHGIEFDANIFKKPVAIAFAMEDEIVPAKEINLFAKKHEALEILGGILEKKMIDAIAVKQLASLLSREELLAKMVGSIASPLSGMVNVLAGNLRGLINILSAYKGAKS